MNAIIDVCQDCGRYIEPIPIPGTGKALIMCVSNECVDARCGPIRLSPPPVMPSVRHPWLLPVVADPSALFQITAA